MQANMHFNQLSLLPLEAFRSCLRVFKIATCIKLEFCLNPVCWAFVVHTNNEPKQIEPNELVVARLKAFWVGLAGIPTPDKKYQVANKPLAVTCTTFFTTAQKKH